ncbi:MAG: hypothetical protein A2931_02190 [Candidatus Niyogibacteria bacterium RIFCSPLOWO2_01_FULL_45_48]|uniref:Uncharacterized protein n=2 Tax=Parcubacteria group TaxID=1794811 RepID=A0A1G2R5A0_9BACT|nr:MAG: hypothetical protein A2835_00280 [Candidatus Niyogibacteria bacterium RIFCSPHIGHO2_01_FULL_45_28]OGZ29972.1 MAG: hypothetical protein A2931_02190 [Candidatus Niyogibacteria bacterium RIFCSPLOWO2_01_FULL_45_48]OHA68025.1 MAG: hypothetical protein A3D59_00220 [Candidatus Wildermuthbacteria bacterium RIFCSPHIGHO2_02_FULL_47_17]
MTTPEKFNAPEDKEKIEFMAWKETVERRIQGSKVLSKKEQNKYLDMVDPRSVREPLDPEDMMWDRKIRDKDFDPEDFTKFQLRVIESKNQNRINFMRSLIKPAKEELEMREWRKKIK